jgi:predicted metal-dependent peptidase
MNARDFHSIYQELIEENPLAIRAVLKVLHVEFTDEVPTLAVTCEDRPRLLVNLGFVREHCRTEAHVKAVICHEFLHVLLRHTERFTTLTPAEHLALDAVINAIIHRTLGPDYSGMMSRYYAEARGIARLLRPPTVEEQEPNRHAGMPNLARAGRECGKWRRPGAAFTRATW